MIHSIAANRRPTHRLGKGLDRTAPPVPGPWRMAMLLSAAAVSAGPFSPLSAQGLFGPGKFKIEATDDRFSTSATTMVIGRNNRLTKKSPAGGIYINGQGLYLNPVAVKSRDGNLVQIGFLVENQTDIDTNYGSPNSLGALRKVSFLVNGTKLIATPVTAADQRFSNAIAYNTITNSASSALSERGMIFLKTQDMAALANAATVAVQIEGTSQTWTVEAKDISKPFLANVRAFYATQVASGG